MRVCGQHLELVIGLHILCNLPPTRSSQQLQCPPFLLFVKVLLGLDLLPDDIDTCVSCSRK